MKNKKSVREQREEFDALTATTSLNLAESVKIMRKIAKKTQIEYAKWLGIARRIIIDIKNNKGNPTLCTLKKIAEPFGLDVFLGKKKAK